MGGMEILDFIPIKLPRVFLSFSVVLVSQHILCTDEYFTMMCVQDSYRIVLCFMQVVIRTTRKFATLGPL